MTTEILKAPLCPWITMTTHTILAVALRSTREAVARGTANLSETQEVMAAEGRPGEGGAEVEAKLGEGEKEREPEGGLEEAEKEAAEEEEQEIDFGEPVEPKLLVEWNPSWDPPHTGGGAGTIICLKLQQTNCHFDEWAPTFFALVR